MHLVYTLWWQHEHLHVCPNVLDILYRQLSQPSVQHHVVSSMCHLPVTAFDEHEPSWGHVDVFGSPLAQLTRRETIIRGDVEVKNGRCGPGAPLCGRKESVQPVVASLHQHFYCLSVIVIPFRSGASTWLLRKSSLLSSADENKLITWSNEYKSSNVDQI